MTTMIKKVAGTLDELAAILDANPKAGLAYGQAWAGNDDLEPFGEAFPAKIIQGDVFWRLVEANFIPTIATLFRKSCLSDAGMIDASLKGVDDYDLWIRISERYEILGLEKPVGIWRAASTKSGQGSSDRVLEAIRANMVSNHALDALARAAADPDMREKVRSAVNRRTSEFLFWNAAECYRNGNMVEMKKSLFAGLKFEPRRAIRPSVMRMLARSALPA
jgi:hypothetical protein